MTGTKTLLGLGIGDGDGVGNEGSGVGVDAAVPGAKNSAPDGDAEFAEVVVR